MPTYRTEPDTMGEMQVPSDALYAAQTQRAVENFPISRLRFSRPFIRALGMIKGAAAAANEKLGHLSPELSAAIREAAAEVRDGKHDDQFVVDIFQTGSGTSTNMNANEVIATRATQLLGDSGTRVHPNDHVNRGQSSNDVIPTAIHVAAYELIQNDLLPAMRELKAELAAKATAFHDIIKIGRTHLQDAVPMRLGQEFSGYARQLEQAIRRVSDASHDLLELPLGGTAIGTGLNADPEFAKLAIDGISLQTVPGFYEAQNHFEAQAAKEAVVYVSGALKAYAVALTKIANDLRWLGSGPRCALGELKLPAVQPGSSIMPGKVNPVIAESLLMICAQVIGHDTTIAWSAAAGNFELNVMMPVIAHDLNESIEILASGSQNFAVQCIQGLEANAERATGLVEQSLAMCTVLANEIGYEKAASLAKEAYASGKTIREVAREKSGLSEEKLNSLLDPESQVG